MFGNLVNWLLDIQNTPRSLGISRIRLSPFYESFWDLSNRIFIRGRQNTPFVGILHLIACFRILGDLRAFKFQGFPILLRFVESNLYQGATKHFIILEFSKVVVGYTEHSSVLGDFKDTAFTFLRILLRFVESNLYQGATKAPHCLEFSKLVVVRTNMFVNLLCLFTKLSGSLSSLVCFLLRSCTATARTWSGGRASFGKGQNGVSTNGATANCMLFDRGAFWVLPVDLRLSSQQRQGVPFSPNLSKFIIFAAAPLMLTPFVRNQDMQTKRARARLLTHIT